MIQSPYQLKISSAGYEVIASGVVHLTDSEVKFDLSGLIIKFRFASDSGTTRLDASVINSELIITLYNFSNSLGEGKIEPIEVGTLNGKRLFSTFFVTTPQNNNLRQFNYTFMLMGS